MSRCCLRRAAALVCVVALAAGGTVLVDPEVAATE
jgi:hypothetical protein